MSTRIATLVKEKDEGKKVRFIVDMLRSGINGLDWAHSSFSRGGSSEGCPRPLVVGIASPCREFLDDRHQGRLPQPACARGGTWLPHRPGQRGGVLQFSRSSFWAGTGGFPAGGSFPQPTTLKARSTWTTPCLKRVAPSGIGHRKLLRRTRRSWATTQTRPTNCWPCSSTSGSGRISSKGPDLRFNFRWTRSQL